MKEVEVKFKTYNDVQAIYTTITKVLNFAIGTEGEIKINIKEIKNNANSKQSIKYTSNGM